MAIEGTTYSGRSLRVILYPVDEDDGTWRLGTAVPQREAFEEGIMIDMGDWRDKEDIDLTSEDIAAMLDAGEPVSAGKPSSPSMAIFVSAPPTYGLRPPTDALPPWAPTPHVSQPLSRVAQQSH